MNLGELRALVRLTLASTAAWPNATVDQWIAQAVHLYSAHFPRRWRATIELADDTYAYALPGGFGIQAVLSVECPAGEDPPRLLRFVSEYDGAFISGDDVYALRGMAAGDTSDDAAQIVFAQAGVTGETAVVEYLGPHLAPAVGVDASEISVPVQHIEALTAYVAFAAQYELQSDEAVVVDASTVVLSQLGQEARRAWDRYKDVMDRLVWLGGGTINDVPQPVWGDIGL